MENISDSLQKPELAKDCKTTPTWRQSSFPALRILPPLTPLDHSKSVIGGIKNQGQRFYFLKFFNCRINFSPEDKEAWYHSNPAMQRGLIHVKNVGVQKSSHWCGVEVRRGGAS
ncbi:hypothetical protein TNCV_1165401 [Trichonephila clavipes]|nr:hypothetical protein TNCV_1165401 [Trichonephila clavipes]